jgi:hypothetical protein
MKVRGLLPPPGTSEIAKALGIGPSVGLQVLEADR